MQKHNEDSRVKIPGILHLMKLGYTYLSLKDTKWDKTNNIFPGLFADALIEINGALAIEEIDQLFQEVSIMLDNEDLGKAFYERLVQRSGIRLIDFENIENNSFHVVTELPCVNGDDEFRPDITLLINGMPLVFLEVKKPNNLDGTLAERKRMERRFQNKKFRKFINITQFMIFSNNMEYDENASQPIQGAFYSSTSYYKPMFNYFREQEELNLDYKELTSADEDFVLKDTNYISIKKHPEFQTNKELNTPTHRICDSLCSKERIMFMLRYALAYVKETGGLEKHIMRYPQIFATKAIAQKLDEGVKKGIIWHTQGSGKTALAYYNVKHLTDYYQQRNIVPKFYFIVDRLDLLTQAKREFTARDLSVRIVNSRDEFAMEIKSTSAIHNSSGKAEITVVNIQKFKDDPDVTRATDYNINIQRIYFLDEVHRSYNPKGSFLANLTESDPNAIRIGLTGTPLILSEAEKKKIAEGTSSKFNSRALFGDYIHKYYYNASIADGYTLRLIREEIETSYKIALQKALDEIKLLKGDGDKRFVYAHKKFVEPMLDYIIKDVENSRIMLNDNTIGAMVVCDSSDQAKRMMEIFAEKHAEPSSTDTPYKVEDRKAAYGTLEKDHQKVKSAGLILHDIEDKDIRKNVVDEFKDGKIDILFVYNMLLTGFDAKRLKKLYIGRVIKSHNLLQTLTRVNRTYKDFKYGYVVDFADIQKEFDKTNKAYFDELQDELGDEMQHYSDLFKSHDEIEADIKEIKEVLFYYDTSNAEIFSQQISEIQDRKEMLKITKALNNAKSLYNLIRLSGHYEMLEKLDFNKLTILAREANNHLALINTKEALESNTDTTNLLNVALEDVLFTFTKVSESEMKLADELKNILQKTRETLGGNLDPRDPEFISLREELERLFKKKNLAEVSKEDMEENIEQLTKIFDLAKVLDRKNALLSAKYKNDAKYMRIHKRLMEKDPLTESETQLFEALKSLKEAIDEHIQQNSHQMANEAYVEKMIQRLVITELNKNHEIPLNAESAKRINSIVVKEYMNEYIGNIA